MLSRKKTKNEVSKSAEVQGKYVKKETSPLLRSECRAAGAHPHLARAGVHAFPLGPWEMLVCVGVCRCWCPSGVFLLKSDRDLRVWIIPSSAKTFPEIYTQSPASRGRVPKKKQTPGNALKVAIL